MKVRADIIRMYKGVHGWVGIISGLALFIAFYAGSITMFEDSVQRWASPPNSLGAPTPLDRTPELIAKAQAAHPEVVGRYTVNLVVDGNRPARLSWLTAGSGEGEHTPRRVFGSLGLQGELLVSEREPSSVGQFIDELHARVGLPFSEEMAMPIVGAIALLYVIAIVSGLVVLLPSLVGDLFAVRIGKNVKRMWLDVHNVLGLFSLPFHIVMALTTVTFALHDHFYDAQTLAFGSARTSLAAHATPVGTPLPPSKLVAVLESQAPGFTPVSLVYTNSPKKGLELRVTGTDPRYGTRFPTSAHVTADPYTGQLLETQFMPGYQDSWAVTVTSFFALHFGSFGGTGVRWAYVLLGLGGAMLFYTGNLLWVESRRKRERKAGAVKQTRSTRILGALTVGVPLGCVAGISVTIAAAKPLASSASPAMHSAIYYAIFLAFVVYALFRGAARSGVDLARAAALLTLAIPLVSIISGWDWYADGASPLIDGAAVILSVSLWFMARSAHQRVTDGPRDSVWSSPKICSGPTSNAVAVDAE